MKKDYLKYIVALLLFGSNGIVASRIDLSSYEIVLLRTFLGSVFLLVIFLISGKKFSFYKHKKDFFWLTASGMAMGMSWILLYEAYARIGVSISSLLYYCGPVIVIVLSPILFHEKLTAIKVMGFCTVLFGTCLINNYTSPDGKNHLGIVCGALSAVMYAGMVIFNKRAVRITGLENAVLQLIVSFLTVALFVGMKQGLIVSVPKESIFPVLVLGLLNTGIGCYFYFSSIGNLPVQSVAVFGYLEPLSAVCFSMLFLEEILLPVQVAGAVLILGGAFLTEKFSSA